LSPSGIQPVKVWNFVNHRTIERRFAPALKKGRGMVKGRLRSVIFERAMAGDTTLLIFLAKTILGLSEKEKPNVRVNVNAAACAAVAGTFAGKDKGRVG
jgi:hypothetical protein